jgi:hypothetical protein
MVLFPGKGTHAFWNPNCLSRDANLINLLNNETLIVKKLKIKLGPFGTKYTDSIFLFENQDSKSKLINGPTTRNLRRHQ